MKSETFFISKDNRKESTLEAIQEAIKTNGFFDSKTEVLHNLKEAEENRANYEVIKITIERMKAE